MIATRRVRFNFALQRAADWSRHLGLPLVIFEGLRSAYPWANDRLHRFVADGMADTTVALEGRNVTYLPYVEPSHGAGRGLLESLAADAAVVVTDEYPTFFLPAMVTAAAAKLPVLLEAIDSNGLLPMSAADREFATAYSFRRFLQKNLLDHLAAIPLEDPLAEDLPRPGALPSAITRKWPAASEALLAGDGDSLSKLPIDHSVAVAAVRGGSLAAGAALRGFLDGRLGLYRDQRNRPEAEVTSGLSPYLHFGHISAHEVFLEVMRRERWTPDHDRWESLPDWAIKTLSKHARDRREHVYTLEEFTDAATHDPLWNAAQTQLLREGTIHNYLRMLWGKKILEWTSEPREALEVMIELNNRYALDGRDPNSYTGIFWVLGRHDRAWGPERPIFGTVRYMSSANTARKFPVREYLDRFGGKYT
jgi:deoxyribodipyrimidine photo-lyase